MTNILRLFWYNNHNSGGQGMFDEIISEVKNLDEVSLIQAFENEEDPLKKDLFQAFLDYNGRTRQREIIKKGFTI